MVKNGWKRKPVTPRLEVNGSERGCTQNDFADSQRTRQESREYVFRGEILELVQN
jgi:hypothetical protein